MAAHRGSQHKLVGIKEATSGTTPATPTMLEIPVVSFTPNFDQSVIQSNQIRTHPYVDKMMQGRFMVGFGIEFELQAANHDILLETFLGTDISAKSAAFADVLKSMTLESQSGGSSALFDQYTYAHITSMSITAAAGETTPVKVQMNGAAKTATLDAGSTVATAVTAAADNTPFTFIGASLSIASSSVAVASGTINAARQVDPLMLWNSATPREFVPGQVTVDGTISVPYDTNTQSGQFTGFTDVAQVYTFGNNGQTVYRRFTFPNTNFVGFGRGVTDRGVRIQEIKWAAKYDSGTTTVGTMTTN